MLHWTNSEPASLGCGREPSQELLHHLCSPQGKNSSVLHPHCRTSLLLACPKCLLCPSFVALTFAWFKDLPLYPVWGEQGRQAVLAQVGWAIGGFQGTKCLCSAGSRSSCCAAPHSLGNGHRKPLLAHMRGSSRRLGVCSKGGHQPPGQVGQREHARPSPAGFALCPLTVSVLYRSSRLQHSSRWPPL